MTTDLKELRAAHAAAPVVLVVSGDTEQSIFCALADEYATDEEAFAAIVEMARSAA